MSSAAIFVQNLLLLGFSLERHATGIFSNVQLDESMFLQANNNKAFEITSHFLFHKLDPAKTKATFQICWPIVDYGRQSRQYRAAAFRWLDELRRDNCLSGQIVLRRSFFEDCCGEKFNKIMNAFSTFVLETVLRREMGSESDLTIIRLNDPKISPSERQQALMTEIQRMTGECKKNRHLLDFGPPGLARAADMILQDIQEINAIGRVSESNVPTSNTRSVMQEISSTREYSKDTAAVGPRPTVKRPYDVTDAKDATLIHEGVKSRPTQIGKSRYESQTTERVPGISETKYILPPLSIDLPSTAECIDRIKNDVARKIKSGALEQDAPYMQPPVSTPTDTVVVDLNGTDTKSPHTKSPASRRNSGSLPRLQTTSPSRRLSNSFLEITSPDVSPMSKSDQEYYHLIVDSIMDQFQTHRTPPHSNI